MKPAINLTAEARADAGKGAARSLRRQGRIPAVIYGAGLETPVRISMEVRALEKEYHRGFLFNKLASIQVGGKAYNVLPRELQLHPVTDAIEHADFYHVEKGHPVKVPVPVKFLGQDRCPGIKRGGALNVVRHEVDLVCPPERIPAFIELDLKDAEIGDSLHISKVALPDGVRPAITDRDFTVATIAGRLAMIDEPVAAAAAGAGAEGAATAEGAAATAKDDKKEDKKAGKKGE